MNCNRYEEEAIYLFADPNSLLNAEQQAAMADHVLGCPQCLERVDEYLRMEFPAPDELDERGELLPCVPWHLDREVPPLRAAASTRLDQRPAGLQVLVSRRLGIIGDVEIRAMGDTPEELFVAEAHLAGRSLRILGPTGTPIGTSVDSFQRLRLDGADAALLRRWLDEGAPLQIEVD